MPREHDKPAKQETELNDHLRYPQAAAYTGIRLETLYALVSQQRIPHIRLSGRMVLFSRRELDEWLAQHAVPAAQTANP